jgi:hypothetical protein
LRAAGNPKLGYFVYSVSPGSVQHGAVFISNSGKAAGTVKIFASDATTGRTTGTVYLTDRKPRRAGSWISLASTSLTLKPGEFRKVGFTVRVPANAKPGQWVGGVVAETSRRVTGPKSKQKANVQIKIRDLTIVAVQVNVPGPPVIAFTIGSVKTGGQRGFQEVVTHMENSGNVMVRPTGTVTVLNRSGTKLQVLTFKMDTFLPQTSIDYPLLLKKALPPGDYSANVQLSIPGVAGAAAKVVSARPTFSVSKQDIQQVFTSAAPQAPPVAVTGASSTSGTPWAVIAAAAFAALILVLVLVRLLTGRRGAKPPAVTPAAGEPTATADTDVPPPAATLLERTEPPPATAPPEYGEMPEPAAAAPPPPSAPSASMPGPLCDTHFWEVAYDRGQLDHDGVWRFPHRCNTCGLELFATDVNDANAQARPRA